MMKASELQHRVTVLTRSTTTNSFNEEEESWTAGSTIAAAISYGTASERRQDERRFDAVDQEIAQIAATVRVRKWSYTEALTTAQRRLRFDGGDWDIESIVPLPGRNAGYSITVRRVLA